MGDISEDQVPQDIQRSMRDSFRRAGIEPGQLQWRLDQGTYFATDGTTHASVRSTDYDLTDDLIPIERNWKIDE